MFVPLRCPHCGPLLVELGRIEVHVNPQEGFGVYVFACPRCAELVAGGSRERVDELVRLGARRWELRTPGAPPVTYDDLLDLHNGLRDDVAWSELEADPL